MQPPKLSKKAFEKLSAAEQKKLLAAMVEAELEK